VILQLLFDRQGPPVQYYISKRTMVTWNMTSDQKHCWLVRTGAMLWHDNARPCTASVTAATTKDITSIVSLICPIIT
jgi:hypothetical protein